MAAGQMVAVRVVSDVACAADASARSAASTLPVRSSIHTAAVLMLRPGWLRVVSGEQEGWIPDQCVEPVGGACCAACCGRVALTLAQGERGEAAPVPPERFVGSLQCCAL